MAKGNNMLSQKQVYMLCRWIEEYKKKKRGGEQVPMKLVALLAAEELNFYVNESNVISAFDIIDSVPPLKKSEKCFIGDGDELEFDCSGGGGGSIHRIEDGVMQTTVFFPEGPVINSYPEKLCIAIPDKDRVFKISTCFIDHEEQLLISKDQQLVTRRIIKDEAVRIESKLDDDLGLMFNSTERYELECNILKHIMCDIDAMTDYCEYIHEGNFSCKENQIIFIAMQKLYVSSSPMRYNGIKKWLKDHSEKYEEFEYQLFLSHLDDLHSDCVDYDGFGHEVAEKRVKSLLEMCGVLKNN